MMASMKAVSKVALSVGSRAAKMALQRVDWRVA